MRRSGLGVLAGLLLAMVAGGGVAAAGPPAAPQISDVAVTWGMYQWDDGVTRCTMIADASLDPAFTHGQPVFARGYVHDKWVGPDGGTWRESGFWYERLSRGATNVHAYMSFEGDTGYYVVDWVRFDLLNVRGIVTDTMQVSTTNTCMNG